MRQMTHTGRFRRWKPLLTGDCTSRPSGPPSFPKPTVPRHSREGTPKTSTLPHPEPHVQPYYAALGLAARGCGRQPLGAGVAAITASSRQRERAAGGAGAKKAFGFPIRLRPSELGNLWPI